MSASLLWIAGILIVYNYFFYPVLISYFSKFTRRKITDYYLIDDDNLPSISLIVAAFNEEKVIEKKIENALSLAYPKNKYEIIIVSDGSDDQTREIVQCYAKQGIVSLHETARSGKSAALNRGVTHAKGEIIVLSDANNDFSESAIYELVKFFKDPHVGGVCGLKHIYDSVDRDSSEGDSLYWRYESQIKLAESLIDSITTADGEIFALRKSLYVPIEKDVINDDAELTFSIIQQNFRVLYEPKAISSEYASIDIIDDYFVKVRMVAGGFQTISRWRDFLFPPNNLFALTFISHKVLRWLAPEFLLIIFLCNLMLLNQPVYLLLFILQFIFYGVALYGWYNRKLTKLPATVYIPYYFTVMNLAAFHGFIRFFTKKQTTSWRKAQR